MPRRTKEDAAKTHESLLIAARSVFSRKGYATTTLEEIAQEAGLTRGAIYWHFGSKAELYLALLDEYSGKGGEIIQAAAAQGGTLVEILGRVFTRMLEAIETDLALREVMEISLFKTERTPDLVTALQQRRESTRSLVESIAAAMQQGIASGELRSDLDPLVMGRAFLAYQNGAIYLWLQDPAAFSLKASAASLADMYLNGIVTRK
jgi:AcrR family transcriptional regulator